MFRIGKFVAQQVLLHTAWKVPKYGIISGPYFLTFGLNTGRYGVSLCIQFECVKIWTRKNSVFRHFSRSGNFEDERFYINLLTTENLRSLVEVNAFSTSMSKQSIPPFLYHGRLLRKAEWYDNIWSVWSINLPDNPLLQSQTIEGFYFWSPRLLVTGPF